MIGSFGIPVPFLIGLVIAIFITQPVTHHKSRSAPLSVRRREVLVLVVLGLLLIGVPLGTRVNIVQAAPSTNYQVNVVMQTIVTGPQPLGRPVDSLRLPELQQLLLRVPAHGRNTRGLTIRRRHGADTPRVRADYSLPLQQPRLPDHRERRYGPDLDRRTPICQCDAPAGREVRCESHRHSRARTSGSSTCLVSASALSARELCGGLSYRTLRGATRSGFIVVQSSPTVTASPRETHCFASSSNLK